LFNRSLTTLVTYPEGLPGSYTIPNSVTSVGDYAFNYCASLASVTIPDSVTSIGDDAFLFCISLTSVTMPNTVTSIGNAAFLFCTNLTSVTIPDSVTSIGVAAFQDCIRLTSVTIGTNVTTIGEVAFGFCTNLTSVTIPNSVTNIGQWAFSGCTNLTSVYFQGDAPSFGAEVFGEEFGDELSVVWDPVTIYYLPGTTGWDAANAWCPTMLWTPQVETSDASFGVRTNQFGFTINWASGMTVVVEASTNLSNPGWLPLATNTLTGDTLYFGDEQWTNYPVRFYRLRSP
jgi:hypothetical protein